MSDFSDHYPTALVYRKMCRTIVHWRDEAKKFKGQEKEFAIHIHEEFRQFTKMLAPPFDHLLEKSLQDVHWNELAEAWLDA